MAYKATVVMDRSGRKLVDPLDIHLSAGLSRERSRRVETRQAYREYSIHKLDLPTAIHPLDQ